MPPRWFLCKINWTFYVHTKVNTCAKFHLCSLIFIFKSCQQLSSAVNGCWQLIWKKSPGIIMYTLKLIHVPNFSSLAWFSFSSAVNSCHELLTAVDSWWQLIWKKIEWNFYVHTKVYTCAESQLSSLILIFISCEQLSSVVDCCWQLMTSDMKKKFTGIFMYTLKLTLVPNFSYLAWFSFLSAIKSCYQLLTADNSC